MSSFEPAIKVILWHEGGWVDNPADPGGETNFGISMLIIKREGITLEQLGIKNWDPGCLKKMNVNAAIDLYRDLFWNKYGYSRFNNQNVATKIFDAAVNMGPGRGHKLAQKAANACGATLTVDGILGPASVLGINACEPKAWLTAMAKEMEDYYRNLATARPALAVFLRTWLKRASWVG